jgi:hypothetical protein
MRSYVTGLTHNTAEIQDHLAHRLKAVCRIFLKSFLDNRADRNRNVLRQRGGGTMNDRVQHVGVRGTGERPLSR